MNVLVSSYACGPNWGSEVGMGWNWVKYMSNHCQLTVITEAAFEKEIKIALPTLNTKFTPIFVYIDMGEEGRKQFWKQGSFSFYSHYKIWQKKALIVANEIIANKQIDLIHQLNLIGFREPGYLWSLSEIKPFVWGPVGGFNQIPFRYVVKLDFRNQLFYFGKNILHYSQVYFHKRVQQAFKHAHLVLADSSSTKRIIEKVYKRDVVLMNETGASINAISESRSFMKDGILNMLWVGKIQGLKALPIALEVVKNLKKNHKVRLTVAGDGPDENLMKKLVQNLGIEKEVIFLGKIPNTKVEELMLNNDLFIFTSLKEGTPHVILEALSCGLPIICHDACGHGDTVDENSGIKIPMISFAKSILLFTEAANKIIQNPLLLESYSKGCINRISEVSWNKKATEMYHHYTNVYEKFNSKTQG